VKGKGVAVGTRKPLSFTTKPIRGRPSRPSTSKRRIEEMESESDESEEGETEVERPVKRRRAESEANPFDGAIESFGSVSARLAILTEELANLGVEMNRHLVRFSQKFHRLRVDHERVSSMLVLMKRDFESGRL
jgi:hypothetical protein